MPIILQTALVSNLYFVSQLLYKRYPHNFLVGLFGKWKDEEAAGPMQQAPTAGLVYYISPPTSLAEALDGPAARRLLPGRDSSPSSRTPHSGARRPAARRLLLRLRAGRVRALLQDVDRGVGLVCQGRRQAAARPADGDEGPSASSSCEQRLFTPLAVNR